MDEGDARYNRVFETYVASEEDLVGLVAYALYKHRKRDWIVETKQSAGAKALDAAALDHFERQMTLAQTVRDFRERAENALATYAEEYVDAQTPRIREEAISKEIFDAREGIRRSQHFWRQIFQSLIVSVVTAAVLVLLVIAAHIFGIDPIDGLRALNGASPG